MGLCRGQFCSVLDTNKAYVLLSSSFIIFNNRLLFWGAGDLGVVGWGKGLFRIAARPDVHHWCVRSKRRVPVDITMTCFHFSCFARYTCSLSLSCVLVRPILRGFDGSRLIFQPERRSFVVQWVVRIRRAEQRLHAFQRVHEQNVCHHPLEDTIGSVKQKSHVDDQNSLFRQRREINTPCHWLGTVTWWRNCTKMRKDRQSRDYSNSAENKNRAPCSYLDRK